MIYWMVGIFLLMCGIQDIREKRIYIWPIIAALIAVVIYQAAIGDITIPNWLGGLAIGGVLLVISVVSRGQVGFGDAMLFCLTGLTVGFSGNIQILFYSFLFVAIVSGYLMFIRHKSKKYTIPFVPYLFMGYCLVAAYGL